MKKRTVAFALCLVILLAVVAAGCQPSDTQPTAAQSAAPTAAKTTQASEHPAKEETLVITAMTREHPLQQFRSDSPVFDWILKATNVKVEFESFPGADWTAKAQTLLATNTMPDIMLMLEASDYALYAREGAFLCISDYMDLMPTFKAIYEQTPEFKGLMIDGKLYCAALMAKYMNRMGLVPMIRGDLVEKYGLTMPTTFDELYNVLSVFKEKNPDIYPWVNRGGNFLSNIAFPMGAGVGMYYDGDAKGGKWLYGPITDNFKTVLEYANKLYAAGILDIDYAATTAQQWQEKMSTGKGLFYFDNPSFAINFDAALKQIDPNYKMTPMPTLTNSFGQTRNYFYAKHWMTPAVVNAKTAEPERVVKFIDWMYSDEGVDITNFGIKDVTYTKQGDECVLDPKIVAEHKAKDSDPWRGFQGTYGLGALGFTVYVDERTQWPFMDPTVKTWYDLWISDANMRDPAMAPSLTEDERTKVADILTACQTVYDSEIHNFITGKKDLADWDGVVEQLKATGIETVVEIYNTAAAR